MTVSPYRAYNPDFDSKRGEKEAATLANKGVAAFIWFQKYVGEYLIFCCWLKYFLYLRVEVVFA